MSDDEDDGVDTAPNYEKLSGMGFICWREIPATGDQVCYPHFFPVHRISMLLCSKDNGKTQVKKNKRKLDAVETEPENESRVSILIDSCL